MTVQAARRGIGMATLVAEIPAYVQGHNPRCVDTMVRCVARLTDLHVELADLHTEVQRYEEKLTNLVRSQPELAEKVAELEKQYDTEAFDRGMGSLKSWLGQQGLRVD
jgi:predicted ATP-grasp superfamily ATP-dependent carboligase